MGGRVLAIILDNKQNKYNQTIAHIFPASPGKKKEEETGVVFQVGDRVRVKKLEVKEMKRLQKDHGGWDPRMEQVSYIFVLFFRDGQFQALLVVQRTLSCIVDVFDVF